MAAQAHEFQILEPERPGETALVVSQREAMVLMPVMDLTVAKQRLEEFQAFVKGYMVEGEDYGKIPGVKKPSLFKPGAEKLCELYGLSDEYPEDRTRRIENWETGLFFYEFTCVLKRKGTNIVISEGKGSCNSYESRYRFRDAALKCPKCEAEAIIKGKDEYGGGWLCWAKKGGCGAKFADGAPEIERQPRGKVENDNLPDVMNTVMKIAKKRSKTDAVIGATRSSGIFTQDVEDGAPADSDKHETNGKAEPPIRYDVIEGFLEDPKLSPNGVLSFTVSGSPCAVDAKRKDLIEQLQGAHGERVELNTIKRVIASGKSKGKTFGEVQSIIDIAKPTRSEEITDEDIPF